MSETTSYQSRLSAYTKGKREVSDAFYKCLWGSAAALVLINGTFNALCGWEQGSTGEGALLTASAYALGELLLLLFSYLVIPPFLGRVAGVFCCGAFLLLSVWSSASFLVSQQYQKDNFVIEQKRHTVEMLQKRLEERGGGMSNWNYNNLAKELSAHQKDLSDLVGTSGGSGSSAMYHWMSRTLTSWGYKTPVEVVSVLVRLFWSFTFALAAISLGSYLHSVYCPLSLRAYSRFVLGGERAKREGEEALSSLEEHKPREHTARSSLGKGVRNGKSFDTGTEGENTSRYEAVRASVLSGDVQPSARSLKQRYGMGSTTALSYLRKMEDEGVIQREGQGYKTGYVNGHL